MPIIVGVYSQLPPGTPPSLLERALGEAYKPILTYIYKNPTLKIHIYLPASILEWFEQNHPEMNMLIADLVKKEQVELISGSYYQSVLQVLQIKDRSSQIEKTTTFLRKRFGKRSKIGWFYNQIWNSSFVSTMALGALDRLIISNYDRLNGCLVATEPYQMVEMGKKIEVFPTNDLIDSAVASLARENITLKEFYEKLEQFKNLEKEKFTTVMINLDLLLQSTAQYEEGPTTVDLFESIIDSVCEDQQCQLLSSVKFDTIKRRGYLSSGWYGRDSSIVDIKSFNDIFIKYDELNLLYGRFLNAIELTKVFRKNKDIKKRCEHLLLRSSHGGTMVSDPSGGYYRQNYRKLSYRYINEAQKLLNNSTPGTSLIELDVDFDGNKELFWQGKNLSVLFRGKGATIDQINYLPTGWNYGDTFVGYQAEVERLSMLNLEDGTLQSSFNDLFLPYNSAIDSYAKNIEKSAYDCSKNDYLIKYSENNQNELETVFDFENLPFNLDSLRLEKKFSFKTNTIVVEYNLTNTSNNRVKGLFGSEMNLSIGLKEDVEEPVVYTVEKAKNRNLSFGRAVAPNLKNFRLADDINKTILSFATDNRFTLLKDNYSVKCATIMGKERLYQYTMFLPLWEFDLQKQQSLKWTVGFRIERRARVAQKRNQ
jgi:hypothetical protein